MTYDAGDGGRAGMLGRRAGRRRLGGARRAAPGSLRELIEHGRIDDLRARIGDTGAPSHPLSAVRLLPPIPDPEKIVCIGLNYAKHAEEGRQDLPTTPIDVRQVAQRAGRRRGDRDPAGGERESRLRGRGRLRRSAGAAQNVDEADALDYVAGYTLFNDLSARDLQFATPQWMAGKVFDGSAPVRAGLVTPDEAGRATTARDRPDAERREDAGRPHREPDLRRPAPRLPPLRR